MTQQIGDHKKDEIAYIPWNTNLADGTSAGPTVNGTVFATEAALTAQITAGITVAYNYVATGIHLISVDTSNAAYSVEETYTIHNTGLTIDGKTVNVAIASFTVRVQSIDDIYGNSLIRGEWTWDTATNATDPGAGNVKANNADYTLITEIYINQASNKGLNASFLIEALSVGDLMVIADKTDTTQFFDGIISGDPVDNGDWYTIPISISDTGGAIGNNSAVNVGFLLITARGMTVDEKQQWRQALGVDGTKLATAGGNLDDVKEKTDYGAWRVYFDKTNGTPTGSGTLSDPISDESNAIAKAATLQTPFITIQVGTFTVPAGDNIVGLEFQGSGFDTTVDMNNRDASGAVFRGLVLTGNQGGTGEVTAIDCLISNVLDFNGTGYRCILGGSVDLGTNGVAFFEECSAADGSIGPTINFGNANFNLAAINGYLGPLTISGVGNNDPLTSVNLFGTITFDSSNTLNNTAVKVSGQGTLIDNSGPNFLIDPSQFAQVENGNMLTDIREVNGTPVTIDDFKADLSATALEATSQTILGQTDVATSTRASQASVDALNDISDTDVKAQVVAALTTDTYAQPGSVLPATSSIQASVSWLATLGRNRIEQDATTQSLKNDAKTGDIATAAVSDDGVTFVRDEFV